ncbi:hypothetical protein Hanom_Chr07g00617381 [Helianthus anomalus]
MGRISMIWSEPGYYPTLKWNGEVMGLKEALRLKSFDSTKLDIRATRTPKGDPPYLTVVKENLCPIREPKIGSSGAKDSVSKVVLYGSEHLSVEDEWGNTEGGEDDAEVRPQDEVDQVTEFSAAGGLLENLDAHLHGVFKKIDFSPLGKPTTGVASNVSRPSPQQIDGGDNAFSSPLRYETEAVFICRELGSGGAVDVDSAQALERYIPDWSLDNKDRIVDALSARMFLFHIGTPAEHAYYRKMSWPELENALMLNQAQSNSLVVEAYKQWIEAESNCRRYEREVAFLKNEENFRSKTKQELSSLRAQVDRLREQVSEAKEVSKASQASTTAAYEVCDKVVHDLEGLKLRFEMLEKKIVRHRGVDPSEAKENAIIVRSTISRSYLPDKVELERARDRAVESHQAMIADTKDMMTRYDGEMVELYSLVSQLMLTKQWFLTEGVAWVVKLVHQSPELDKEVANLGSARTVEEVLGYDVGAKDTLDVAIKAFYNFHISMLDKVSGLVNEPLSAIKEKSKLPIIKED